MTERYTMWRDPVTYAFLIGLAFFVAQVVTQWFYRDLTVHAAAVFWGISMGIFLGTAWFLYGRMKDARARVAELDALTPVMKNVHDAVQSEPLDPDKIIDAIALAETNPTYVKDPLRVIVARDTVEYAIMAKRKKGEQTTKGEALYRRLNDRITELMRR